MKQRLFLLAAGVLLGGCYSERSPYTAAEETSNPPRAEAVLTNTAPVSDRTNRRGAPPLPPAPTNQAR